MDGWVDGWVDEMQAHLTDLLINKSAGFIMFAMIRVGSDCC